MDQGYLEDIDWQVIAPNEHGDWINQRRDDFNAFTPIGDQHGPSLFSVYSNGIKSQRDAWVWNYSRASLGSNVRRTIENFNSIARSDVSAIPDPTLLSWSRKLARLAQRREEMRFEPSVVTAGMYRPFAKVWTYFGKDLVDEPGKIRRIFPTPDHENFGFYVVGAGSDKPFAVLATRHLVDIAMWGSSSGQYFSRYTYEATSNDGTLDFSDRGGDSPAFRSVDNIADLALKNYRRSYGDQVTKDDIFYYIYGLLHSPTYLSEFSADLKKMLPRIPMVKEFNGFVEAGHRLMALHLNYETIEPYALEEIVTGSGSEADLYRVQKMTFGKGPRVDGKVTRDRSRIAYNARITVVGIPDEAYSYMLGARSAIEWIMDRYRVKSDEPSGIVNDPNDWAAEHGEPRYILDLLKRIVTVSVETMKIVDSLPPLEIIEPK